MRAFTGKDDTQAAYHQGQVDLLVPLVKAYGSDQAFRICETAIQTYGGAGYTKDYPVEQYCRDAKISSIYEGTNHIQAMDIVGRKLGRPAARTCRRSSATSPSSWRRTPAHPKLGAAVKQPRRGAGGARRATMRLLTWFQSGNMTLVPLYANRFLEMMSETAVAWMLLEGARIADAKLSDVADDGHRPRVLLGQDGRGALLRPHGAPGRGAEGGAHDGRGQVAAGARGSRVRDGLIEACTREPPPWS